MATRDFLQEIQETFTSNFDFNREKRKVKVYSAREKGLRLFDLRKRLLDRKIGQQAVLSQIQNIYDNDLDVATQFEDVGLTQENITSQSTKVTQEITKISNKLAKTGPDFINEKEVEIPRDFSSIETNGYRVTNLQPEMRVFVCGKEMTDVLSLNVNNVAHNPGVNPSTCRFSLMNPNNKYTVTPENLYGLWRDDEETKRIIFKLKKISKVPVYEGMPVFTVNDPVTVFLKDRFTPFYRFAFTGFVNIISEDDSYNRNTINIDCEDVTKFVRMKEFNVNPGLIEPGFLRAQTKLGESQSSIYKSLTSGKNPASAYRSVFFGFGSDEIFSTDQSSKKPTYNFKKTIDPIKSQTTEVSIGHGKIIPATFQPATSSASKLDAGIVLKLANRAKSQKSKNIAARVSKAGLSVVSNFPEAYQPRYGTQYTQFYLDEIDKNLDDLILGSSSSDASSKRNTSLANMAFQNIGYFKPFELEIATDSASSSSKREHFSTTLNKAAPLIEDFYSKMPRWYLTDIRYIPGDSQGTSGYNYSTTFTGVKGINPLVDSKFIDSFEILPNLIESIGDDVKFKDPERTLRNIPYPYDVIKMNTLGTLHTLYVRHNTEEVSLNVNPRLFLVYPDTVKSTSDYKAFNDFNLISSDYENAATIIERINKMTDFVSWVTPMGDFVIEPQMYDTYPWSWDKEVLLSKYIRLEKNQKDKPVANATPVTTGFIISEGEFQSDYVLNSSDLIQLVATIDSTKFVTLVEVAGDPSEFPGVFSYTDLKQFSTLSTKKDGWPFTILIADGLTVEGGESGLHIPIEAIKKLRVGDFIEKSTKDGESVVTSKITYDPLKDFTKQFGYRTHRVQGQNPLLRDQAATDSYAVAIFNRILSETFAFSDIKLPARPGALLNRPYLIPEKGSIVTSTRIGTSISYGSEYSTTLQGQYLRNQSILGRYGFNVETSPEIQKGRSSESLVELTKNKKWLSLFGSQSVSRVVRFPYIGGIDWNNIGKGEKSGD